MRITNHTLSESLIRQIERRSSEQARLQAQVATGQRIAQPEDDPSAVGRVLQLESEQRQIGQFQRNADRALELSQASFSGLQQIKKVSDRVTEIGTLGAGAISPAESRAYASEVDQLIEQTLQLGNTRFRNDYIFAGTAVDAPPFVATRDAAGAVVSVAYAGNGDRMPIQLSEHSTIEAGASGETNVGVETMLNRLVALRDALRANDPAAVTTVQAGLIESEDLLVTAMAEHGGVDTRIEANRIQQQQRTDNLEGLVSAESELDLPAAIVRLSQSQTAYQAALQSAANIMKISLLDYIR
jgi:flagellar hook-associated protein 3 FlgL